MRRLAGLGGSSLLTAGCFAYTIDTPRTPPVDPRADVRPDTAEICVLRTSLPGGTQLVRDNGQLVGATSGRGYFCYAAGPGIHRVASSVGDDMATLDLALAPGERVFLDQSYRLEEAALVRLPESLARAALPRLTYVQLVAAPEPVLSPPAVAGATTDALKPLPPPPAPDPRAARRRPSGMLYGVAAGLGLGASHGAATPTSAGFAALGSVWIGFAPSDLAALALRLDISLVNGAGVADAALHVAFFPGGDRSGRVRDLMIFADGGVRLPTSTGAAGGGMGRLGLGWEAWRLGPVVVGPFVSGEITRSSSEGDAALIGGLGASLYPKPARR